MTSGADLKFMFILGLFPLVFTMFMAVYLHDEVQESDSPSSILKVLSIVWDFFTAPELLFLNVILVAISTIGGLIVLARYVRG